MNNSTAFTIAAFAAMIICAAFLCACSNKKTSVYAPRTGGSGSVYRPVNRPGGAWGLGR